MTGRALTSQERQVRMIPRDHPTEGLHTDMDGTTGRLDVERGHLAHDLAQRAKRLVNHREPEVIERLEVAVER